LLPVGGIAPKSMRVYVESGATGFGLGSALYRAGDSPQKTYRNAVEFVTEARNLFNLS
jgi:2-dehydro-3-deoxyphosphogalactonate aldolase